MSDIKESQQAEVLMTEGKAAFECGDYASARGRYEAALTVLRAAGGAGSMMAADCLDGLGDALLGLADYAGAGESYTEALAIHETINGIGHISSARSINGLGRAAYSRGDLAAARGIFEHALSIRRGALGEVHCDVAASLSNLGTVCRDMGEYSTARRYHEQALSIRQHVLGKHHSDVAASLNNLGIVYSDLGNYEVARTYYEQALAIRRQAFGEMHLDVAASLNNLGTLFYEMSELASAESCFRHALAIKRGILGEWHPSFATSLNNLGVLSRELADFPAAKNYYEQALEIRLRTLGEFHPDVAMTFDNLGNLARQMGDYAGARSNHLKALALRRQLLGDEHSDVATSFNNLGITLKVMGDFSGAKSQYERALAVRIRIFGEEHPDVAASLHNIGNLSVEMEDYPAAKVALERALALRRRTLGEAHFDVAKTLNALGILMLRMEDSEASRNYLSSALEILRRGLSDLHPDLIYPLIGLADVVLSEDVPNGAARYLEEALCIALISGTENHLPEIYNRLAKLNLAGGARDAAIFFGKQAINAIQSQRGRLKNLDPELQRSFLATKETAYRELADLLVEAGRLGEAQQVLAMLKEEELFDLLRRDAASDPRLTFAQLTRLEAEWRRHGDAIGADIVRLTEEVATLRKLAERTAQEEARLTAAREELDAVSRAFRSWLDDLRGELAASSSPDDHSAEINLSLLERLQSDLRALGPGVALLSYVVSEKRLSLILTGERLQVSREVELSATHLNRLVHEFRFALDQKLGDALILGQALWRHLVGPVASLIHQMRTETLMIVPYGTLRYLPFAALHDGEAYLAERFATPVLTLAAHASLRDAPSSDWQVAGFGVSREVPGYRQLHAVADELGAIVRTPPQESGIYPGVIRLDERFTEDSFADALEAHQAVHVASHFVLNPAQGLNSHLLLGDGRTLTLDRLRDPRFDFHDVELVTLSACETAIGAEREDGREFEGFAALVQQRGAGAVIASLWPVADESTASFMANFYRARRAGQNKAAALRSAQLALLRGNFPHPYHWAPFILMGNWL